MNPLIGLMGAAGAGKNTVGEILLRAGWQQMAFADPLRDGLAAMLWLPTECYVSRKEQPIEWLGGATPRMLMQTLGTEWGRNLVCADIWVRIAERRLDAFERADTFEPVPIAGVVFTDVRFPDEAAMIRRRGGALWRIERPGATPVRAHVSETAAADVAADRTVVNDGTLLDLEMRVAALLSEAT